MNRIPPTSAPEPPVPIPTFDYSGTGSYTPRPDTIASMATKTVKYIGLGALLIGACYLLYSLFRQKTSGRPQQHQKTETYNETEINQIKLPEAKYEKASQTENSTVFIGGDTDYTICNPNNTKHNTEVIYTYFILALAVSECNKENTIKFLSPLCDNLGAAKNFKELITTHKSKEAIKELITFVQTTLQKGVSTYPYMPKMAKDPKIFAKAAYEVLTDKVMPVGNEINEQVAIQHYKTLFTLLFNSQTKELVQISPTLSLLLSALNSSVSFEMKFQSTKKCEALEELVNTFVERYKNELKEAKLAGQSLDARLYTKEDGEYPIVTLFKKKFGE